MHLRILDLDGSVSSQPALRKAAPWSSISTIALRDLGPRLRLWSRNATIAKARARLREATANREPTLTFLGSGDFHHLAALLIEHAAEPVTVVHIDNHPDWVRLAPRWHCGSWINQMLRLTQVKKVLTIGPCSDDLARPDLKGGNLPALSRGDIALFPWQHAPSRSWLRIADGAGHHYENGSIVWRNLADGDFDAHLQTILAQIATAAVWISVDKDVLPESEVITNWDQGQMPLSAVLRVIHALSTHKRIIGADICGEYSVAHFSNPFKRWEARMDQPARDAADSMQLRRNEQVNIELARAINGTPP